MTTLLTFNFDVQLKLGSKAKDNYEIPVLQVIAFREPFLFFFMPCHIFLVLNIFKKREFANQQHD